MGSNPLSSKRSNLWGVIRLTRPGNLAIAAATVYALHWGWLDRWTQAPQGRESDALVMVGMAVVVLLMAAGNLINAYFDVEEDRINRPDRAIVDRLVKRRVLILTHQVLNAIGLILAGWLSYRTGNVLVFIFALLISYLLWRYSARWKGRPIVGNVVVASLLAAVPLWLLLIEWNAWPQALRPTLALGLGTFSIFALAAGWMREMVKDALDIDGDRAAGKNTWAVIHGTGPTRRRITQGIGVTLLLYILVLVLLGPHTTPLQQWGCSLPALTLILSGANLWIGPHRWNRTNALLKLTLVLGFTQSLWLPVI